MDPLRSAELKAGQAVVDRLLSMGGSAGGAFETTIPARRHLASLFGGQVAAQALVAASRTLDAERPVHSLHAYFIRRGEPGVPIRYEVDRTRDGRSFATRRVTASQEGKVVLELLTSFHHPEPGANWQMASAPMPPAPASGGEPPDSRLAYFADHLDIRLVGERPAGTWQIHPLWFRTDPPIGQGPARNAAMLTYASDIAFMTGAREPGTSREMSSTGSLDHAIWFHRPPQVDEWLLFRTEPVANIGARGMVRGTMHTADGLLVATVAQEVLLRPAAPDPSGQS